MKLKNFYFMNVLVTFIIVYNNYNKFINKKGIVN